MNEELNHFKPRKKKRFSSSFFWCLNDDLVDIHFNTKGKTN